MFDVRENFYIEKAYRLLNQYQEKREHKKANFISELIELQMVFSPSDIFGYELLLNDYDAETVTTVMADLNYSLTTFRRTTMYSSLGLPMAKHTIVAFTTTEGD